MASKMRMTPRATSISDAPESPPAVEDASDKNAEKSGERAARVRFPD